MMDDAVDIGPVPDDDQDTIDDLDGLDNRSLGLQADIDGGRNSGDHAGQRGHSAGDQDEHEHDQGQDEVKGAAAGECDEAEEEAVHGGDCLASAEARVDRVAVADPGGEGAQGDGIVIAAHETDQQDDKRDLQKVKGHGGQACPLAEDAAGVAAAQVTAAVLPHVGVVKVLADDQGKGNGTDQITCRNRKDQCQHDIKPPVTKNRYFTPYEQSARQCSRGLRA